MRKYLLFLALCLSFLTLNAQTTVWSENFDDEDVTDWTLIDSDGDGFLWSAVQLVDGDTGEPIGTPVLTSVSWSGAPLTPDNWAISPAIDLTSVSGDLTLKWSVFASDPLWNLENYGVYVSTTNTAAGMIAAGELFTEDDLPSELEERTLDLSDFAGQTVYVGFRHYDVTDQFRIAIDDVSVEAGEGGGPTEYCDVTIPADRVEPITRVLFAGIDNSSSEVVDGSDPHEFFLDVEGNVEAGETYPIALEGNTDGPYTNTFTVFIDWNQDGDFADAGEMYEAGSIFTSNGTDGQQATADIMVPVDAMEGATRMRIIKDFTTTATPVWPSDPCGTYDYGQAEDYTLNVGTVDPPGEGCLEAENGQYPSTTFVPACNGAAEVITSAAWTGEYSLVTVTNGEEYIFSVSDPSYFITIGNEAGDTVITSGTGSVTWTATMSGNVRFYAHFTSACDWDATTLFSRLVQCGEVPPPPSDCEDYEVLSNNLENGLFFGGDTAQHLATDIPVGDTGFTISGMEPTVIGEATSFEFIIYSDAAGLPGTELETRTGAITGSEITGNNFGFDFIKYTVEFDSPLDLAANTTYWIEIISDADGWESTSVSSIGHGDVFYNSNVGEGVWTSTGGDEMVFNLICDEVIGGEECTVTYDGSFADGLGDLQVLQIANDFTVDANKEMSVEQVKVNLFSNVATASVFIYADAGGVPDTFLGSQEGLTPTSQEIVGNAFGFDIYEVVLDLPSAIIATGGATETIFWVGISTTMGSDGTPNYWEAADATTNGIANVSSDGGITWVANSFGQDGAFIVSGTCGDLGIDDMSSFDFAYYPNPVKDELNITSAKLVESVSIYNLAGQQVTTQKLNVTNGKVSTSALAPGVYVFRAVLQGGQVETFKIIKK